MTAKQFTEVSRESFNWLERRLDRERFIASITAPGLYEIRDYNGVQPWLVAWRDKQGGHYMTDYGARLYRAARTEVIG